MTKLQALFVLYLRHENFIGCSWRALAGNYYERYNMFTNKYIPLEQRSKYEGWGGNQIDGMELEHEAAKILKDPLLFKEGNDLYECDLTMLNVNLKRHIK